MKPKLIIILDGGIVRDVLSDKEFDVAVIDYDTDGMDEKELSEVPIGDEKLTAWCYMTNSVMLPKETERLYTFIENDLKTNNNE